MKIYYDETRMKLQGDIVDLMAGATSIVGKISKIIKETFPEHADKICATFADTLSQKVLKSNEEFMKEMMEKIIESLKEMHNDSDDEDPEES